jgi:hypothetical protein
MTGLVLVPDIDGPPNRVERYHWFGSGGMDATHPSANGRPYDAYEFTEDLDEALAAALEQLKYLRDERGGTWMVGVDDTSSDPDNYTDPQWEPVLCILSDNHPNRLVT